MNLEPLKNSPPGKLAVKIGEDKAINWATLIAWSALLAMFPILVVMASILGFALSLAHVDTAQLYGHIASAFPDRNLQAQVLTGLDSFKRQSGVFAIVGFVGLMLGGSALFGSMEQAFAVIYHTTPRSFVRQKLLGFAMIIVFTVLAGLAVGTSSILPTLKNLNFLPAALTGGPLALVLQIALGVLTGFVLYAVIYYVVPNRKQDWGQVWPGALLAGALFEVVTLVFPVYLEINKGISNYGKTFALFFILMTFFYFVGIVTMVGVELNSVLYPLPVEQPSKAVALAPPQSEPEGEKQVVAGAANDDPVEQQPGAGEADTGIAGLAAARDSVGRIRTLVGVGAIAWALGVVVGQRSSKRKHPARRP